ncbi:MAG TPA: FHA domain-containing protein [Candidatus Binataceae bacterium]|nr:FHA domain-containing protein [Candidatus Binataceae bacterium]
MASRPGADEGKEFGARLVAIGGAAPREYRLRADKTAIGYSRDNDLVIDSSTVSARHAVIQRNPAGYSVADLESTNGTFVNGSRIQGSTLLARGDEIRFGDARFAFLAQTRAAARRPRGLRPAVAITIAMVLFAVGFGIARYRVAMLAAAKAGKRAAEAPDETNPGATAAPSAASSGAATPAPAAEVAPEWLAALNGYRRMSGLDPVSENAKLTDGDRAHVEYLLANYSEALRSGAMPGGEMHEEREGSPGYTPEGAAAGKQSDVDFMYWHGHKPDGLVNFAILDWISGAFHRLPLLNPNLRTVGYYDFCGGGLCVAALNAIGGAIPARRNQLFAKPVEFPPDGAEISLRTFNDEWPDPLASCPGYAAPSGLPITLALGSFVPVKLESFEVESIAADGSRGKLDACGFDPATYVNSEDYGQTAGRGVLAASSTVAVIPRRALDRGGRYAVHMRVNGRDYQWTFRVSD